MASLAKPVDWRQARQWLIDSGVIPPTHRVTKPSITLVDFARSLRDGVFLCSLLDKLKPNCVEYTAKPVMQHSYLKNINAFLSQCTITFGIAEADLFNESELYDVDNFSKVMLALSKLSHTHEALSMGWKPFPTEESNDYYNAITGDDIYAPLLDFSVQNAVYANVQDLYLEDDSAEEEEDSTYGYGDEKIYDSVCFYQHPPSLAPAENDYDEKRSWVLQELLETERSFVKVLEIIANDYHDALKGMSGCEELETLFRVSRDLLQCHMKLKDGFSKCTEGKASDQHDVSQYFFKVQEDLLKYGIYAAHLPNAQEKAKQLQNRGDTGKVMQATMEKTKQRFPLSDLLPVPIQRFLKYPLLIKDLEKCNQRCAKPNQNIISGLARLMALLDDIAKYINQTKGDFETIRAIDELEANIMEYNGPRLTECGRYHLDGELKFKLDEKSKSIWWAFLFDRMFLLTKRQYRFGSGIKYYVKAFHFVHDLRVESIFSYKGGKFSYAFRIKTEGRDSREYVAYSKTEELRTQWIEAIQGAKNVVCPRDAKKGHHQFELTNFDYPKTCSNCNKLLHGCYFQGYACTECNVLSHRECLATQGQCSAVKAPRLPTGSIHKPVAPSSSLGTPRPMLVSIPTGRTTTFIAAQKYDAIGRRRDKFMSFDKGEEIDIVDTADPDWWEGISRKTNQRGLVPASYLIKKNQNMSVESSLPPEHPPPSGRGRRRGGESPMVDCPWYLGMKSRIEAEYCLQKMWDGVFLIRESKDRPGEYAVALKWNQMPKHIKVMKNPQTDRFFVSDACDFNTIQELVEYYQKNTLGVSFPGVDTTLKYPYQDVVNGRISYDRRHPSVSGSSVTMGPPQFPAPPLPTTPTTPFSPPPGVWAEAVMDFHADGPGQLSFLKHDQVKIISKDTRKLGWCIGESNGKTGLFPLDHVYTRDMR